ncbi:hypothetical protein PENFLA_c053G03364 [Penicillium flavigenum]|uniref:Uncharacterized protein n=1 Tax=Penicillium flavigenum TaxID=254877 RepID=A0A1V6SHT4_9EURO|nr:hypothetical protein PENFLA_c053G03364 [Penicillium flavigenum]
MPDKGKKRAAEWCTFCEMGGHTREECRRWAACQRDTMAGIQMAMEAAYKPQPRVQGQKKARCHYRGGQKVKERKAARDNAPSLSLPPPPPTPSAEASGPASTSSLPMGTNATTQGSPGVEPGLLSRLVQVSQSEAELLVRFLEKIRKEGSTCEGFVENPLVEDEPGQESTQGPCEEPKDEGKWE